MGVAPELRHALHVSLRGRDNETYRGTLVLKNWTLLYPGGFAADMGATTPAPVIDDPTGASYYVIAVVLVYGMSIVMLIASHIKRKHQKLVEDRQIHKYLQEFMIVKEKSSRENYRNLKKTIVQKLNWERNPTYRNLSRVIIPAIAVPVGRQLKTITEEAMEAAGAAPVTLQPQGRRSRRGSSPAPSMDFSDTHPGSNDRKQRRKGMGNLFTQGSAIDFTHSVLEKLTELNDIRQEARARGNSIAVSSTTSACSFDAGPGVRSSEAESMTGSDTNLDNQSDTDSQIILPAITLRPPIMLDAPPVSRPRLSPLPTIEEPDDTETGAEMSLSSDSSSDEEYTRPTIHSSEDDVLDIDREDIWLMSGGDMGGGETRGTSNNNSPKESPRSEDRGIKRHVHFSASTKRKSGCGRATMLIRQDRVLSESSDFEEADRSRDCEVGDALQITCV